MKNRYKSTFAWLGAMLLLVVCTPDNPELGNIIPQSELNFSITQDPEKDNIIYLENKTAGIIPYWDWGIGYSNKQKDTIQIRFAGEYEIKFHAFDNGGSQFTSEKVTVSKNDEDYFKDPVWNLLTNGSEGKTWVWNNDIPACYGNGSAGSVVPEWWQVSYAEVVSNGWEVGEMVFDLNGAQNFGKTLDNGTIEKGFFNLDVDKKQLTILNANILQGAAYADDGAAGSYYVITKLTEAEMTLARQGDGWQNTWVFKAK